ncbi:MAG: hypothetical protein ACK40K_07140 [Raineya sp.]
MLTIKKQRNLLVIILIVLCLLLSALTFLFLKQSKELRASQEKLASAEEKIHIDSLLLYKYQKADDELLEILIQYDSSASFVHKKNMSFFLRSLLNKHISKDTTFQKEIANRENQINRLRNQMRELKNKENIFKLNQDSLYSNFSSQKVVLDSIAAELEKVKSELMSTAIDSTLLISPNGHKIYFYGKLQKGNPISFGIGFYEGKGYYIGEWKENKREGWGKHTFKDGSIYEGYFENDQRNGFGTYYYYSGEVYRGYWKNDLMDGEGEISSNNKKPIRGVWSMGKKVKSLQ